jgi:hypothetical protein
MIYKGYCCREMGYRGENLKYMTVDNLMYIKCGVKNLNYVSDETRHVILAIQCT